MSTYEPTIIQKFLIDHIVDLRQFCFVLKYKLNEAYDYNRLTGDNLISKSLSLVQIAEQKVEVGDLVFHITQYWLKDVHGNPRVLYQKGMHTQLETYLRELQEHGEQERAEQVTQMLVKILPPSEHNKILSQPAPARLPADSEWNQQRIRTKIHQLQQHLNLLDEKLAGLKKHYALETRPEEKLRIKQLIAETETECHQTEQELHDLNNQTIVRGSKPDHDYRFGHSNQQVPDLGMQNQLAIEPTKMRDNKPVIRYFVSYAHDDDDLKNRLLKPLKQRLAIAKDYTFEAWDDEEILAGEHWHEQIQAAVAGCQFGLLLVSPAFLGSTYIQDHELRAFIASNPAAPEPEKWAIPVALKRIPFDDNTDLKGLERLQIFHDSRDKTFQGCIDPIDCDNFALELFQQILKTVKRYGAHPHLTESEPYGGAGEKMIKAVAAAINRLEEDSDGNR